MGRVSQYQKHSFTAGKTIVKVKTMPREAKFDTLGEDDYDGRLINKITTKDGKQKLTKFRAMKICLEEQGEEKLVKHLEEFHGEREMM